MDKRYFLFLLFVVIVIGFVNAQTITGEVITGEVTSDTVGLTVQVVSLPTLTIISPRNESYFNNDSLFLEISSSADFVWYSLDDGVNNISFNKNNGAYFNVSEGQQTLFVYANNTYGWTYGNVSFNVDINLYDVIYDEFKGVNRGSSTEFNILSFEQIQNLSDIELENTEYGKISFKEIINVTDDGNFNDNETDIDVSVNVSFNRIELIPENLSSFNVSSTLELYNLTFTNPRVLKDGSVCSDCEENSYTSGEFSFNVTDFSIYSAGETPVSESPGGSSSGGSGSGSGGGGGGGGLSKEFGVDRNLFDVRVKKGEVFQEFIEVTNNGESEIEIKLEIELLNDFLDISESVYTIEPGKALKIPVNIYAEIGTKSDVYLGRVLVKLVGSSESEEVNMIINVRENFQTLFDIVTEIVDGPNFIIGEKVEASIFLFNLAEAEAEVTLSKSLKNFVGYTYSSSEEELVIGESLNVRREIDLPKGLPEGDYVFYSKLTYRNATGEDITVSSADSFKLYTKENFPKDRNWLDYIYYIILVILVIVLVLIIYRKIKRFY